MAINSTFYLDAANFTLATSVYLDLSLSNLAPDGFYKFGTTTRQQSSGILLAAETCATCPTPCGTAIAGSGSTGIYVVNLNVGSLGTGAIRIMLNPDNVPDGIRVTYNGVVYNKLSSENIAVLQSTNPTHYTIVGTAGNTSTCATWFPAGGTLTQSIKVYNPNSPNADKFEATVPPTTQTNTIATGDFFVGARVENCWMIIPKPTPTPSALLIEIIGPCTGTGWTFSAACPAALPAIAGSVRFSSANIPCATARAQTYYFAKVHSAADTFVGLYDYVFTDVNGQFPLIDGHYLISNVAVPNKVIHVVNGVVTEITACT